jgi:hypothetical protein
VFSDDSIVLWHLRSFARKHALIERMAGSDNCPRLVRLRSARATSAWLAGVQAASSASH